MGIGTVSPEVKLDIAQNGAIRVGQAYFSSGGNYAHVANNAWYDGSAWRVNGTPGALIQETDQHTVFYRHNGAGDFIWTALFHGDGHTYISGGLRNEEGRPAFLMSVAYDDCGWGHPYMGCPAGYSSAGTVHTGAGRCDGWVEGCGYENGCIDSGWMALCVAQ